MHWSETGLQWPHNALLIAGVDASIDSQPFYPPKLSLDWELKAAIQPKQREYTSSYGVALAQEVDRLGGCWFDPRLLPAGCRGVPEQDASP